MRDLAVATTDFTISHDPREDETGDGRATIWLELLASGLTFDLAGLAPRQPAELPQRQRCLGLSELPERGLEAITLSPGPHLAGGLGMVPVVRTLALLAASLTEMAGVQAVAWHPSGSWIAPQLFRESVGRWIEGGVFPGLTLASLILAPDGGMQSQGLAIFTGQELRLEPELTEDQTAAAKLGVRLLDFLVEYGRVDRRDTIKGPDGVPLRLEPSANGRFVRVRAG